MSSINSNNLLNRRLEYPNYSQIPLVNTKQFGDENHVDLDKEYVDIQPITILVDSRNRDTDTEEPGKYTIYLPETFKHINSIELIGAKFPNPVYNITKFNNCFYFQDSQNQIDSDTNHKIVIPTGNYNAINLGNTLNQLLNDIGENTYLVKLDHITHKYTITSDGSIFNIIFTNKKINLDNSGYVDQQYITPDKYQQPIKFDIKSQPTGCSKNSYIQNSIGPILGFKALNLVGQLSYTGQYAYNLYSLLYLSLYINDFDRIHSANKHAAGAFCVMSLEDSSCHFSVHCRNIENIKYIKYFNPALNELNKFSIKFLDPDGNIYDFNGRDHQLLFEIALNFGPTILRKGEAMVVPMTKSNI